MNKKSVSVLNVSPISELADKQPEWLSPVQWRLQPPRATLKRFVTRPSSAISPRSSRTIRATAAPARNLRSVTELVYNSSRGGTCCPHFLHLGGQIKCWRESPLQ